MVWRLKLDKAQNPYPLSNNVYNSIRNISFEDYSLNEKKDELIEEISSFYKTDKKNILFANSVSQIQNLIIFSYLVKGAKMLSLEEETEYFSLLCNLKDSFFQKIDFENNIFNKEKLIENIDDNVKIIYLSNPNFDTGELIDIEVIEQLLKNYPDILFVIDCTFIKYSNCAIERYIELTEKNNNLLIIKSYFCDYLPLNLDIAIAISNRDIISNLKKLKNDNHINLVCLKTLSNSLNDKNYMEGIKKDINETKDFLSSAFKLANYKLYPSQGNFITVDLKEHFDFYFNKFLNNSVLIKKYPENSNFKNHLRIAIPKINPSKLIAGLLVKRELLIFESKNVLFDFDKDELLINKEKLKDLSKKYDLVISDFFNFEETTRLLKKFEINQYFIKIFVNQSLKDILVNCPFIKQPFLFTFDIEKIIEAKKLKIKTVAVALKSENSTDILNNFKHHGADVILNYQEDCENYFQKLL